MLESSWGLAQGQGCLLGTSSRTRITRGEVSRGARSYQRQGRVEKGVLRSHFTCHHHRPGRSRRRRGAALVLQRARKGRKGEGIARIREPDRGPAVAIRVPEAETHRA